MASECDRGISVNPPDDPEVKSNFSDEKTTVSQKIEHLRSQKKSAKCRLTKARNYLQNLISHDTYESKNTIRRQIKKVRSEFDIVEKIVNALKEDYALNVIEHMGIPDIDRHIEALDSELTDIEKETDSIIKAAKNHLDQRLREGEYDSDSLSEKSSKSYVSKAPSVIEKLRSDAKAANDRLISMQDEQRQKERELQRKIAELELMKQRTEEARKIAAISEQEANNRARQNEDSLSSVESNSYPDLPKRERNRDPEANYTKFTTPRSRPFVTPVALKGVELPIFSGEDKANYETWKAAFMSIIDRGNFPVSEKMLRLQSCLAGKALKMVQDLGFSETAYEKAKSKLEKKYGGERRLLIKHMTALRGWKKVRHNHLEDYEDFLTVLERVIIAIQDTDSTDLTDHNLNLTAKEKLSEEDIQAYKHWLIEHSLQDSVATLVDWIELQVQVLEETKEETSGLGRKRYDKADEKKTDRRDDRQRSRGYSTVAKTKKCLVTSCEEEHPPWSCQVFKSLSVPERKSLIVKNKRCFRCLAAGHFSNKCQNARRCGIDGCNSNQHSRYLHESSPQEPTNMPSPQPPSGTVYYPMPYQGFIQPMPTPTSVPNSQVSQDARSHTTQHIDTVSLMVLPAVIANGNKRLRVNVMLDPCSTGSYVTEAAAAELNLHGQHHDLVISGTGGAELRKYSRQVNLKVISVNNDFASNISASVLDTITGDTPAFEWSKLKQDWPHLKSIPFQNVARRRQIDVLIGSDHPVFHHVLQETHGAKNDDPIARLTNLGWVCFGPTLVDEHRRRIKSHFARTYHANQLSTDDTAILRQFWELDSLGIIDTTADEMNPDEKAAITTAKETMRFKDGLYCIGVPWKTNEPQFTSNYDNALNRLKSQEKSLIRKGPETVQSYNNVIEDYKKKGYIQKVEKTDDSDQWFLPHFAVVKEDRQTTKIRIVFDAAAKDKGKCLNDAILPGPKLQQDLTNVLMRFRRAPVALSGDISEMFLQVGLLEEDRRYHRFLWRNFDVSKEPDVYEFQRLVFGNTASPFCSQYVIQQHAKTNSANYPEAANSVRHSMYVDDVLDSCEDANEAKVLRNQLSELLACAGFRLRKWASNDLSVVEDISEEERLPSLNIQSGQMTCKVKTLGVLWKADSDVFTFNVQAPDMAKVPTKRHVLSAISTLFDPLQLISPFTVRAKILLQDIWAAGLTWDDPLPDGLLMKWKAWAEELTELSKFEIPRCLRQPKPTEIQLHMFSDASKEAYGTAAYLVCLYEDFMPTSCLIASKSRVAPLKVMTIPRLELMGAVISSRLSNSITKSLCADKVVFWTDSTNVIYWVRNQSRNFKPFIANRISEIHTHSQPEQWRHVPGKLNPADLPTRGMKASELTDSKFWKEGPEFLKDETMWPTRQPNVPTDDLEFTKTARVHTSMTQAPKNLPLDPSHFSDFQRLVRVTGWVLRFVQNCRLQAQSRIKAKMLSVKEINKAEFLLIKYTQAECFPTKTKDKSLANLTPVEDEDGLLRVKGRLANTDLAYGTKHPIILPRDHAITRLIVRTVHDRLGHGTGVDHALTELRTRYWILKGRRLVRDTIHKCPACRLRFTAKPIGQMMAPLPRARVKSSVRAFERVGVDYGGPYLTKQGRGRIKTKRYLCLFTCLTTRAVHLEMSYALDTDSFINAFTRMTSRRGTPIYVVSDNGTNFVAAERELRELVENLDETRIAYETCKVQPIDWNFNPPSAPHFGGVFEAMIKSAKKAIKGILGDADITDEELHTAMCGAEKLLNSRPITYVSADADDLCPLTPNHFIVGQMGGAFAAETCDDEEVFNPRKRWHRVQQLIGQVWKRWRREFLPSLNVRKKWFHPQRNLSEGDVVLMVEPNASRGDWPLARVKEVFPGADGLVRVVKVLARGKEYLRPVHRLCPLEYA